MVEDIEAPDMAIKTRAPSGEVRGTMCQARPLSQKEDRADGRSELTSNGHEDAIKQELHCHDRSITHDLYLHDL